MTPKRSKGLPSQIFTFEKNICRLVAAWCTFAAITALKDGNFAELSFAQDISLGTVFLSVVGLFLVFSAVHYFLDQFWTDTWFLLISATVCVVRWLSVFDIKTDTILFTFAVIISYCLFLYYFLLKNELLLSKIQPSKRTVTIIAIVCGLVGGTVIAVITCLRYMTFSSPNFDFGIFSNMFYYMKTTGLPLVTSERDALLSHFVVHLSPICYLILPFYFIFPSPITLQICQALLLASGVIPVVLLCRKFNLSGKVTILAAIIYSFYPAISSGCFYDFHENCFLTPLLLFMFYFFEKEKYLPAYLFAAGVLMVKEDAAVYVIIFALYLILAHKKYLHGAILAVGSIAYFGIALAILTNTSAYYAELYAATSPNPSIAGPMINRFDNLIHAEADGLLGAIKTALVNPGYLLTQLFSTGGKDVSSTSFFIENTVWAKFVYFMLMLLPVGMIPFCTKKTSRWLLIAPILLNLLSTYKYQYSIVFQYHFGITAFLIYAMIVVLPDLKPITRRNLISFGAAACCCLYIVTVLPTLNKYTDKWEAGKETYIAMEEALESLPDDASLCVSSSLLAHVADRDFVYEINYHGDTPDVDYVVVTSADRGKARWKAYVAQGYEEVEEYSDTPIAVLKKGADKQ